MKLIPARQEQTLGTRHAKIMLKRKKERMAFLRPHISRRVRGGDRGGHPVEPRPCRRGSRSSGARGGPGGRRTTVHFPRRGRAPPDRLTMTVLLLSGTDGARAYMEINGDFFDVYSVALTRKRLPKRTTH